MNVQVLDQANKPAAMTFTAAGVFKDVAGYPPDIDLVGSVAAYRSATGTDRASIYLSLAAGKPCIHISSALPGWAYSCPACFCSGARST